MASPALKPMAIIVTGVTGAAIAKLYMTSKERENEDNQNVENEVDELRDLGRRVQTTIKNAADTIQAVSTSVASQVPKLDSLVSNDNHNQESRNETNSQTTIPVENVEQVERETGMRNYDGTYCHTCSGPRIWFFAEKLRLKRRFTPYPDPPRDIE